jgi:hypothetical protein
MSRKAPKASRPLARNNAISKTSATDQSDITRLIVPRIALVALLLMTSPVWAKEPKKILGWGGYYCSRWNEDHASFDSASWLRLSETARSQAQWVMGYFEGAAGPKLPRISDNYILARINDYCLDHPEDPIERAANTILQELLTRR